MLPRILVAVGILGLVAALACFPLGKVILPPFGPTPSALPSYPAKILPSEGPATSPPGMPTPSPVPTTPVATSG